MRPSKLTPERHTLAPLSIFWNPIVCMNIKKIIWTCW
jgi:hypothetical protein